MKSVTSELLLKASTTQGKEKAVSAKTRTIGELKGHVAELAVWDDEGEDQLKDFQFSIPEFDFCSSPF